MAYHHRRSVEYALGKHPADLILTNCKVVDVQSGLIKSGPVIIRGHRIVGLYDESPAHVGENTQVMDLKGRYVLPGFFEPHIHIESSMLTLTNFSRVVLPHGTTTVVNDPHEIANVMGARGVRQIMDEGYYTDMTAYFTVPSCVPPLGHEFETAGADYTIEEIKSLLMEKLAIGLGEMMNFPGIVSGDIKTLEKVYEAYRIRGFKKTWPIIDGHSPGLSGTELSAYIAAGIMADHECTTGEELEERVAKGMFVMVRNGSSARNMETLLSYVAEKGIDTRRLMFCSDDKNPYDLLNEGHIDFTLKEAMRIVKDSNGRLSPIDVIRMATLTPAEFFHMSYRGRLGIGTRADIVVVDDLDEFNVHATIRYGEVVAMEGELLRDVEDYPYHENMLSSVKIDRDFTAKDFEIESRVNERTVRVIKMLPGQLLTEQLNQRMKAKNGAIASDTENDILKIAVIERHLGRNNHTLGFVNGFGIKKGAVAATIGHDAHNLSVIGANDADMACAVDQLKKQQGGIAVTLDGKVIANLPLRVAGLMSVEKAPDVVKKKSEVYDAYRALGGTLDEPIISMSFLQLPVIPALKITDKSLVAMGAQGPEKVGLFID
jgi:adenine deaminase